MSLDFYIEAPKCPHCGRAERGTTSFNLTHNLGAMAQEAGVYNCLWRPEEHGITTAAGMVAPLEAGLAALRADPAHFMKLNPPNGWGSYENLCEVVEGVLNECRVHPTWAVEAWR